MKSGQLVLYVSPKASWSYGSILRVDGNEVAVQPCEDEGEEVTTRLELVHAVMNVSLCEEEPHDLLDLTELHEGHLLQAVKRRFTKNVTYTDIGRISLSINPFTFNIPWYSSDQMPKYCLADSDVLPHVWRTGRDVYQSMMDTQQSQTVLVSGDSGAGKTEAVKLVLRFLGELSCSRTSGSDLSRTLHTRITATSPVLETFGNAKTVRNDNSSRFGKFLQVQFDASGQICGALTTSYLLEQSRVISCGLQERLFHCYYQLLSSSEACKLFSLESPERYPILEKSAITIPHVDDAASFAETNHALRTIGMTEAQQWSIWAVIAGILHATRVVFFEKEGCAAVMPETGKYLKQAACAWGVSSNDLEDQLTTKIFKLRGSMVKKNLTAAQATATRDSLCKGLYKRLFEWLISSINKTMNGEHACATWIGLLDIFGFEKFKENDLEQLCINLTNEMLQNHYNEHIFKADMAECQTEGIDSQYVTFHDNTDTVELISGRGGILALLDDQSQINPADDESLLAKVTDAFESHRSFYRKQLDRALFRVNHYAAEVPYTVLNWGSKNLDTLKEDLVVLMQHSKDKLIAGLLPTPTQKPKSVVSAFTSQLDDLMQLIRTTSPSWIRCIKPNSEKRSGLFDGNMVMSQLKSSGVLETVAIRKAGYPVRIAKEAFSARFKCLLQHITGDVESTCRSVLTHVGFSEEEAQLGKTKVFLKSHTQHRLESLRSEALRKHIGVLHRFARYKLSDFERAAASLRANEEVLKSIAKRLQMRSALVKTHDKSRNVVSDREREARDTIELGVVTQWRGLHNDMWTSGLQEAEMRSKKEAGLREQAKRERLERLEAEELAVRQQRKQLKALQDAMSELYHKPSMTTQECTTAAASRAAAEEALVLGRTQEEVQLIKAAMDERAELERQKGMERIAQEEGKQRELERKRERLAKNQTRSMEIKEAEQENILKKFQQNEERRRRGIVEVQRVHTLRKTGMVDSKLQNARQRKELQEQQREDAMQGALRVSEWHHTEKEFWAQTMGIVKHRVTQHSRKEEALDALELQRRKNNLNANQRKAASELVRQNLLRDATVSVALQHEKRMVAEQKKRDSDNRRLIKNAEEAILAERQRHHKSMLAQVSKDRAIRASSVARESAKLADEMLERKTLPSPQRTPPRPPGCSVTTASPSPVLRSALKSKSKTNPNSSGPPISAQAYERLLGVSGTRDGLLAASAVHTDPLARLSQGHEQAFRPISWKT